MVPHSSFYLLVAGSAVVLAGKSPACSKLPYNLVTPFSTVAAVTSFCASKFPISTPVTTVTGTVTSTSTISSTVTATTVTSVTTSTTVIVPATATVTVNAKRSAEAIARKVATTTSTTKSTSKPTVPCPPQLAAVSALGQALLATACSCVLSTPTSTVSVTSTVVATATTIVTTTTTVEADQTTIIYQTATTTVTATAGPPSCTNPAPNETILNSCQTSGDPGTCYCELTTEGTGVCIIEEADCTNISCNASSDCAAGYSCITSFGCSTSGAGICYPSGRSTGNTCLTPPAQRMVRRNGKRIPAVFVENWPPVKARPTQG